MMAFCNWFMVLLSLASAQRPPHHFPPHWGPPEHGRSPPCRFAKNYRLDDVVRNPEPFVSDVLYWEGKFAAPGIGFNGANGMTYDGTLLDPTTGLAPAGASGRHNFSAASKESLHVMLLAQGFAGNADAARVLSPQNPKAAPENAFRLMQQKLDTYLEFNRTYPGFGGYLPWYNNTYAAIEPTSDWVNRLPALDNGELIWAVYAATQALSNSQDRSWRRLGSQWQNWLDYTKKNAAKMFYDGSGRVCAVITLDQTVPPNDPRQNYSCEGTNLLNDPYEGELFTWWLYFFGDLPAQDKNSLWTAKRAMLQSIDYDIRGVGPITVQKGYWFSSHEQWKILEMPYYDVDIVRRVFDNGERARTCNSNVLRVPGMYASVNNVSDSSGQIIGYISNAGIPSIAFITDQELDVITPYSVFPTVLASGKKGRAVGMAWYWNMIVGKKMQNPYGSTESERIDGKAVSSFVSWDSKITTVVALLGGVTDLVREKMKADQVYDEFISVTKREYSRMFKNIKGENLAMCLPSAKVPDTGFRDYTSCRAS